MANIIGTSARNRLNGTTGDDTIDGRAGADTISGGGGDDVITGGAGADSMSGGAGADTFAFAYGHGGPAPTRDAITDFRVGTDLLRFPAGAALHTEDDPNGQWVHYGSNLDNNDWVQLRGVRGATLAQLTGTSPPPPPSGGGGGWVESFDNGVGLLSRTWGHVDASVRGQVTLTAYAAEDWGVSRGAMVSPTGAGYGYGTYRFVLNTHGGAIGDYALLWPASDRWPGPELDVVELDWDGRPYSAIHWRGEDGGDRYDVFALDRFAFDPHAPHAYEMEWRPGRITVRVDGVEQFATTNQVPRSFADGGENAAPGVGMQPWWAPDAQDGDNRITVYEVGYTPLIA